MVRFNQVRRGTAASRPTPPFFTVLAKSALSSFIVVAPLDSLQNRSMLTADLSRYAKAIRAATPERSVPPLASVDHSQMPVQKA